MPLTNPVGYLIEFTSVSGKLLVFFNSSTPIMSLIKELTTKFLFLCSIALNIENSTSYAVTFLFIMKINILFK